MSKVSISDLADMLAEKSGLSPNDSDMFLHKMFEVINAGLQYDKQVKVKWLGTFKVQAVKDRASVDVNTGERIVIEGRDKIAFTPDSILKEIVNKPFAQFETVVVNDGVDFDSIDRKFENETEENETAENEVVDKAVEAVETVEIVDTVEAEKTEEVHTETDSAVGELQAESQEPSANQVEQPVEAVLPQADEQPTNSDVKPEIKEDEQPEKVVEVDESTEEEHESLPDRHHMVIPRYVVVLFCIVVVALMAGMGYFAFNYGKIVAQRDQLAQQLPSTTVPAKPRKQPAPQLSNEQLMRKKALEDSLRMAKASEAVKAAELAESKAKVDSLKTQNADKAQKAEKYDQDVRVRTGAYRIVGVQQVVTVQAGQTASSISNRYLGPGMECYVEAMNGTSEFKEGQKVKIPKLELKKKKR